MSTPAWPSDPIRDRARVGQPTRAAVPSGRSDTLTATVPIAVIWFDFDPLIRLVDTLVVRWETIALALIIASALVVAGVFAKRAALRSDDLLFIAIGIVPGAVVAGRVGFALLHLDYYRADPMAILDPTTGGLQLGLGVAGGIATAWYVARLLDAPIGPWLQVAALPVLFTLGAGKLAMVLGGAGQGQPTDFGLGDRLSRSRPVGIAGPRAALAPSAGVRGDRDARAAARDRAAARGGWPRRTATRRPGLLPGHRRLGPRPGGRQPDVARSGGHRAAQCRFGHRPGARRGLPRHGGPHRGAIEEGRARARPRRRDRSRGRRARRVTRSGGPVAALTMGQRRAVRRRRSIVVSTQVNRIAVRGEAQREVIP